MIELVETSVSVNFSAISSDVFFSTAGADEVLVAEEDFVMLSDF